QAGKLAGADREVGIAQAPADDDAAGALPALERLHLERGQPPLADHRARLAWRVRIEDAALELAAGVRCLEAVGRHASCGRPLPAPPISRVEGPKAQGGLVPSVAGHADDFVQRRHARLDPALAVVAHRAEAVAAR